MSLSQRCRGDVIRRWLPAIIDIATLGLWNPSRVSRSGGVGRATASHLGFTLLEVLVAFIILSIALVPLLQGGSLGLQSVDAAGQLETAAAIARSHLELFDELTEPDAVERDGDDGPYHWRLQVTPIQVLPPLTSGQLHPKSTVLYHVLATVSWPSRGKRASVQLDTKRLSPVPPIVQ